MSGAENPPQCFDRIEEALDILQRFHPTALQSIQAHFEGILIFGNERFRVAYWLDAAKLCVLTEHYVTAPNTIPEHLALTLVHENMHALLRSAGVPYVDGRRAPIEVLCAMAELAAARRICHDHDLIEQVERRIEDWATSGEGQWSNETMRQAKLKQLRDMGIAKWLVQIIDRVSQFNRRRAA